MAKFAVPPMPVDDIIAAVDSKRKGTFRKVTWITNEFVIGSKRTIVTVTLTGEVQLGVNYNHKKSVIARKAAEDEAFGGPKPRRDSSYVHDEEHGYIVYGKNDLKRPFLQVFPSNRHDVRTKEKAPTQYGFYVNGEVADPVAHARLIVIAKALDKAEREKRTHDEHIDTWVLPLDKILSID